MQAHLPIGTAFRESRCRYFRLEKQTGHPVMMRQGLSDERKWPSLNQDALRKRATDRRRLTGSG